MNRRATCRLEIPRWSELRAAVLAALLLSGAAPLGAERPVSEAEATALREAHFAEIDAARLGPSDVASLGSTPCVGGNAGGYPCSSIDLEAFLSLGALGGAGSANDIWGWRSGSREFALVGLSNGTAFVEVSDPDNPVYLGRLPTATSNSTWRDVKTYADHAFVVSEAAGHGMQVFDLTALLTVTTPPVIFAADANYTGFSDAHNVVVNEATGFAYVVGGNGCSGGLHMVNIQNPTAPVFAGCFSADGYTHDAQCVVYAGPDTTHAGREICFNANEDTLTIADVENKASPFQIARETYPGVGYTHQGWLTEDHRYFLIDDELDEFDNGHNTRTYVWDVQDLDNPVLVGNHTAAVPAIDHNLYVAGDFVFEANYRSGLRILRIDDLSAAQLTEVGFFDVYPANDNPGFDGAWSVYPFFPSGTVVVSGIDEGLFVLRPTNLPLIFIADHEEGDTSDWSSTVN